MIYSQSLRFQDFLKLKDFYKNYRAFKKNKVQKLFKIALVM